MTHIRVCLCSLLITAGVSHGSQSPVKAYTIADGLASNRVQGITQDSHGFLWFGTNEGLSRFDGFRFVTYGREQGLPHDHIQACLAGPNDQLWVATARGLVRFDPTGPPRQKFIRYRITQDAELRPRALLIDSRGRLWCGTDQGLFRFNFPAVVSKKRSVASSLLHEPIFMMQAAEYGFLYNPISDRQAVSVLVERELVRIGLRQTGA